MILLKFYFAFFMGITLLTYGYIASANSTPPNRIIQRDDSVRGFIIKLRHDATNTAAFYAQSKTERRRQIGEQLRQQVQQVTQLPVRHQRASSDTLHVLNLPQAISTQQAKQSMAQLAGYPDIDYIEIDKTYYPLQIPNDPLYGSEQSYLANVSNTNLAGLNLPKAWDITTGSADITIAILDSGILDADDLSTRLVGGKAKLAGYDFISNIVNAADSNKRDSDPTDASNDGHGTFVTSIIGAQSNNQLGITGVDWQARLLTVRTLGLTGGSLSDVMDGIRWAAGLSVEGVPDNPHPANIINLSIGSTSECGRSEQLAINQAVNAGVIVVAAAGNVTPVNGKDYYAVNSPANCENVIAVAAIDTDANLAAYSSYGTQVDISTIGELVGIRDNQSYTDIGTSFSSPLVAGVAGLMLAANTNLTNGSIEAKLVPHLISGKLRESARAFTEKSNCDTTRCGAGILDAYAAVTAIQNISADNIQAARIQAAAVDITDDNSTSSHSNISIPSDNKMTSSLGGSGSFSYLLLSMLFILFILSCARIPLLQLWGVIKLSVLTNHISTALCNKASRITPH